MKKVIAILILIPILPFVLLVCLLSDSFKMFEFFID